MSTTLEEGFARLTAAAEKNERANAEIVALIATLRQTVLTPEQTAIVARIEANATVADDTAPPVEPAA